ncbi:tetratricopeptide repeat protein [Flavobacterium sp.]|uniref:tetratricopeptide repeat protein n=1 Tax=Flavobacterium sp. TaxID=239 RepID=UPI003C35157A
MFIKNYLILLSLPLFTLAQTKIKTADTKEISKPKTNTLYYRDSIVSMQVYFGIDKKIDSLKTYHPNGKKNELFYYDDLGRFNGEATQYNKEGEKMVTTTFDHGKIINRTDYKLPYENTRQEDIIKKGLEKLIELNKKTNYNPKNFNDIYARAHLYKKLNNPTLAIMEFRKVESILDKYLSNPTKPISESAKLKLTQAQTVIYDALANIYSGFEIEKSALHYYAKAVKTSPEDYRVLFNFTNYLTETKSYVLSETYLNRILIEKPNHSHALWGSAYLYLKLENYEKALYYADLALKNEEGIIKRESGNYDEGPNLKSIRGLVYHKLGESEKGIADLKEVLARAKNNSYAMRNLGIIYLDQKNYKEACMLFQKAKALDYIKYYDDNNFEILLKSACEGVEPELQKAIVKGPYIYPNPVKDIITILNYDYKTFDYELFDYQSISVLKGNSNNGTIDVSELPSGFYILKTFNNEFPQTFKIIKE